jgi:ABC-type phosphate transport system substrate-binding protein
MRMVILCLAFLFAVGCFSGSTPGIGAATATRQAVTEPLSASGQQEVRTIVGSGRLAALQWPVFSDYEKWVKEFYESAPMNWPGLAGESPRLRRQS